MKNHSLGLLNGTFILTNFKGTLVKGDRQNSPTFGEYLSVGVRMNKVGGNYTFLKTNPLKIDKQRHICKIDYVNSFIEPSLAYRLDFQIFTDNKIMTNGYKLYINNELKINSTTEPLYSTANVPDKYY